ncbi:ABC transporter permease [Solibacillus merdavium]|uniref:ABC transporter permease n=1 Tax=Solibacillus merdavium TaxID=2762218 RepID=A0ABR8XJ78_9BACL|nr:ABC transporter permease [Solibacillus merdavium]MBD8031977.1 ABC transporter permease [Solibacillus merdavium]
MRRYFVFELKQFFTSKKNIAVFALLTFAALFYAFKLAPAYDPIEKVDYDEIEARYLTRAEFLDSMFGKSLYGYHESVGHAVSMFGFLNPYDERRLQALDEGDLRKYADETSAWYYYTNVYTYRNELLAYNPRYYMEDRRFAEEEAYYAYFEQFQRYDTYKRVWYDLTIEILEQRTALQTLERLLKGPLPYILLIATLLLTIDIVTKDRRHPSVLKGFPIADWKRLLVKVFVGLIGSVFLWIPIIVGLMIVGFQFGSGNLDLPVPVYGYELIANEQGKFVHMSMGIFLFRCFLLLATWMVVIVSAVLLCSIIFRQEMFNLLVGGLLIFGDRFYASRGVGYFWNVEYFPISYVQVGNIVSKYQNFYFTSEGLHDMLGLKLLLASAAIILVLTLLISLSKRFRLIK